LIKDIRLLLLAETKSVGVARRLPVARDSW
jgi:hypothetical protein